MSLIVVVIVTLLIFLAVIGVVVARLSNAREPQGRYGLLAQLRTSDGAPIVGDPNARVVFREFMNFASTPTANYRTVVHEVIDRYVSTGQARVELRVLAWERQDSLNAGLGALCAERQRRFWDMHDALFAAFQQEGASAYELSSLRDIGSRLGLDTDKLIECILTKTTASLLTVNDSLARAMGATGTPALMVSTDGGQTFRWFTKLVDGVLTPYTQGGVPFADFTSAIADVSR
jgi:protein-disulfide isomerase